MNDQTIITIEAGNRGGRPCIRGMRIAVSDVLGAYGSKQYRGAGKYMVRGPGLRAVTRHTPR